MSKVLSLSEAVDVVKNYKKVIAPRFENKKIEVYLYGSYGKGCPRTESDIDVAVVVPHFDGDWLATSTDLWMDVDKVNPLIEPVLIAKDQWSPLYDDVMRTGIAV